MVHDACQYLSFTWNPKRHGASSKVLVWLSLLREFARLGRRILVTDIDRLPAPYEQDERHFSLLNVMLIQVLYFTRGQCVRLRQGFLSEVWEFV